jgi:hypothetical protein
MRKSENLILIVILLFSLLEFMPFPHSGNQLSTFIQFFNIRLLNFALLLILLIAYFYFRRAKVLFLFCIILILQMSYGGLIKKCNTLTYFHNRNKANPRALFLGTNFYKDNEVKIEWNSYFDSWNILIYSPNHKMKTKENGIEKVRVFDANWYELSSDLFK